MSTPYQLFNIPAHTRGLIFDIDGTLYKNDAYCEEQGDCQVRAWAKMLGISNEEARQRVDLARKEYAAAHNGAKTSLANIMLSFGISLEQSIEWRKTLINPEGYLSPDPKLHDTLLNLHDRFRIVALTNNSCLTGHKNLAALGIEDCFDAVLGLEDTGYSKPHERCFQLAAKTLGLSAGEIVSIGDRYDVDLATPINLGMGGILVDGPEIIHIISTLLV